MSLFIEIDGRWIQRDHVTHIGPIDECVRDSNLPPGTRSYIALSTNKYLYLSYTPEVVVSMMENGA
jgi:hypothetical protein